MDDRTKYWIKRPPDSEGIWLRLGDHITAHVVKNQLCARGKLVLCVETSAGIFKVRDRIDSAPWKKVKTRDEGR